MKKPIILCIALLASFLTSTAGGVLVHDASQGIYLKLFSDSVRVQVQDQVAQVSTIQLFYNDLGMDAQVKFGIPLNPGATATRLRWKFQNSEWFEASFAATPQDTTFEGGVSELNNSLIQYLGTNGIYMDLNCLVPEGETLTVQMDYVMLLPYELGVVSFTYPSNYSQIQEVPMAYFNVNFELSSQRSILSMHPNINGNADLGEYYSTINIDEINFDSDTDLKIEYELSTEELGVFPMSTYLDSEVGNLCDDFGEGFFGVVIEPGVNEDIQIIQKVFTLIIDRSGSMGGDKIIQAREAASFIINNLNEGDKFNIVVFDSQVESFANDHVNYNITNQYAALNYISNLNVQGSTNISGAFTEAIADFGDEDPERAHIIVFFTDGEATAGITGTDALITHVNDLVSFYDENLIIFTFGIGASVNTQLLTALANNNSGLAEFVANDDLEESISNFYLLIQNPVLLNTQIDFDPPLIDQLYPFPLQNLYIGQQLLLFGRFPEADAVTMILSGDAFGQELQYEYDIQLSDSSNLDFGFLPKMWADQKIKSLQTQYYLSDDPAEQETLQAQIVELSTCYSVISDFTSFTDDTDPGDDDIDDDDDDVVGITEWDESENAALFTAYPNPFISEVRFDLVDLVIGESIHIQILQCCWTDYFRGNYRSEGHGNDLCLECHEHKWECNFIGKLLLHDKYPEHPEPGEIGSPTQLNLIQVPGESPGFYLISSLDIS